MFSVKPARGSANTQTEANTALENAEEAEQVNRVQRLKEQRLQELHDESYRKWMETSKIHALRYKHFQKVRARRKAEAPARLEEEQAAARRQARFEAEQVNREQLLKEQRLQELFDQSYRKQKEISNTHEKVGKHIQDTKRKHHARNQAAARGW